MQHATALNDAYRALKDDGKRARYILALWGRPIDEKSGSATSLPFDFLEEIMDVREAILEAKHSESGADGVSAQLQKVQLRLDGIEAQTADLFRQHESAEPADRKRLEVSIEQSVHQSKYLISILNEHKGAGRARL